MGGVTSATRFRKFALWAATALVAFACAGPSQTGQTLAKDQVYRVNIVTEPKVLDPGQTQYVYEAAVDRQAFEPLLQPKFDSDGNAVDVQSGAAEKWETSTDGLTWTFHLRQNSWSDGQPVKAQDFVAAWRRILDPTVAAPYADPFFDTNVAGGEDYSSLDPKADAAKIPAYLQKLGLSAPDDKTFVVKLQKPAAYFKWVATLWMSAPVRQDIIDKYGSDKWGAVSADTPKTLVSNGAFMVSELVPQDHVTLVPNPHWTGKKPTLTKLVMYEISDDNQALSKYRTGELDDVTVPLADTNSVKNDPKLSKDIMTTTSLINFWVGFNTKAKPFDNPKVRMAFTKAVDRQKLVDLSFGRFTGMQTFIPKGMPGYSTKLDDVQKFDAAAAKQLLKDAGVDPATLQVKFLNRNITDNTKIAEVLVDQWKTNLGVNVQIDTQESKAVSKLQTAGNYQFSLQGWGADYPDPQDWYDIWLTGSGNQFSSYKNPQYDSLVQKADSTADQSQRLSLYEQAEELLLKDAPGGMLYSRITMELIQSWVKGCIKTPLDDSPPLCDNNYTNISIAQH